MTLELDLVATLPAGATALGSSPTCQHEIYAIGQTALSMQGHPEFDTAQVSDLYERRREVLGEAMTDAAVSSATRDNDGLALTEQVLRYFLNG